MAVLFAWVDFAGREIDPAILGRLRSQALARAAGKTFELTAPGRYILAIQTRLNSHPPLVRLDADRWLLQDCEQPFQVFDRSPDRAAALALIEPNSIQLSRDRLGQRPLCFARLSGGMLVASGDAILAEHPDVDSSLSPAYLADFFSAQIPEAHASVFCGVRLVPAGSSLALTAHGESTTWATSTAIDGAFRWSDAETIERYRAAFRAAINEACQGTKRVGLSLSGGLDSSALVPLLRDVDVCALTYGSSRFPDSDERPWASALASQFNLQSIQIDANAFSPLGGSAREAHPDEPSATPYREIKTQAYALWREQGVDVVLNGNFADHLNAGHYYWLDDALRGRRWREIGATIRYFIAQGPGMLWRDRGWRGFVRRQLNWKAHHRIDWLRPELRQEREKARSAILEQFAGWPRPDQAAQALGAYAAGDAAECYFADRFGIEVRQPYRHWPLVQLMLSLPTDKTWRYGVDKWLQREACRNALPDTWRVRPKSADLTPYLRDALQKSMPSVRELVNCGRQQWEAFIDPETVDGAFSLDEDDGLLLIWLLSAFGLWQATRIK